MHRPARKYSAALLTAVLVSACGAAADQSPQMQQVYDDTGKLQLLKYDSNGNGTVDTWSYMDGPRIVRIELDADEDGVIDRWEYYTPSQQIEKVGSSRGKDGNVDSWAYYASDGSIVRLERSTRRDGVVSRTERYQQGVLLSAEEDTNGDAHVDKWEEYDQGRLATVAFDTTHRGTPDRRLVYGVNGTVRLEISPNGDGKFVAAESATKPVKQ